MKTNDSILGRKWIPSALLALCLALQSGCAALLLTGGAAAGAGTFAYVKGKLKASESAPLPKVYDASLAAMQNLEFAVTTQEKDALSARIVARAVGDKKVQVNLKKATEGVTEIRIRVGTFGDESTSRLILDKIRSRL